MLHLYSFERSKFAVATASGELRAREREREREPQLQAKVCCTSCLMNESIPFIVLVFGTLLVGQLKSNPSAGAPQAG